jgi:hypothetical protein
MAEISVTTPDIKFSGLYFPQIYRKLLIFKRQQLPELTDESDFEVTIQLLKAFGAVGHFMGSLLDLVAREAFLPSARFRKSVVALLSLIGYRAKLSTAGSADLLLRLSQVLSTTTVVLPARSEFSTAATSAIAAIPYEVLEELEVDATDEVSAVFALRSGIYTDHTAAALALDASTFQPFGGVPAAGDVLLVGLAGAMFDKVRFVTTGAGSLTDWVWEFYDGNPRDVVPTTVKNLGAKLRVVLDSFYGSAKSYAGATARISLLATGAYEDAVVQFGPVAEAGAGDHNYIETSGLLGQSAPSEDADEYVCGADWNPLGEIADQQFATPIGNKDLEFPIPQTATAKWIPTELNGVEAYWIRGRVVSVGAPPVSPTIDHVDVTQGNQYVLATGTQGRSVVDEAVGTSDGSEEQTYRLGRSGVIEGSIVVKVNGVEWTEVSHFLNSTSISRHYRIDRDPSDATQPGQVDVIFGDGTNGVIPTIGEAITVSYRYGAEDNGNVGADSIRTVRSAGQYIAAATNPRSASGWNPREGSTEEDLARLKVAGPASLRALGRAVTPKDVEALTVEFVSSSGARPFVRARAVEEMYGPKTIGVIVVGAGGGAVSSTLLTEIQDYFNGTRTKAGVLLANQRVVAVNYTVRTINIVGTVKGGGDLTTIQTALASLLDPVAKHADGATYVWDVGGLVGLSRITSKIHISDSLIYDVDLDTPNDDVQLGPTELPKLGTVSITFES